MAHVFAIEHATQVAQLLYQLACSSSWSIWRCRVAKWSSMLHLISFILASVHGDAKRLAKVVLQLHLISFILDFNGLLAMELETLCKSPQAMARTSSLGLLAGSGVGASGVGEESQEWPWIHCVDGKWIWTSILWVLLMGLHVLAGSLGYHGSHCRWCQPMDHTSPWPVGGSLLEIHLVMNCAGLALWLMHIYRYM